MTITAKADIARPIPGINKWRSVVTVAVGVVVAASSITAVLSENMVASASASSTSASASLAVTVLAQDSSVGEPAGAVTDGVNLTADGVYSTAENGFHLSESAPEPVGATVQTGGSAVKSTAFMSSSDAVNLLVVGAMLFAVMVVIWRRQTSALRQ